MASKKDLIILGIESSCDEMAAAVYSGTRGMLANQLFSQIALHRRYGGVVPELASRSQLEKVGPIIKRTLEQAELALDDVDVIAVTNKPGLPGSLLVGVCFAKALAWAQHKKIIGVNHLEAHIFSASIDNKIPFPYLCITASGGHTALYLVQDYGDFLLLGQTMDDAAGEAFDKVARIINLEYPGGPLIEKLAEAVQFQDFFHYPRSTPGVLTFSFSGLKTAVMYDMVKRGAYDMCAKKFLKEDNLFFKQQVASSLLVCIADIFEQKVRLALKQYSHVKALAFVGGVARNNYISSRLKLVSAAYQLPFFVPQAAYCTDNGAMVAFVGYHKALKQQWSDFSLDID
jgi:N6-L-threonylcarbamoyladenine synthase